MPIMSATLKKAKLTEDDHGKLTGDDHGELTGDDHGELTGDDHGELTDDEIVSAEEADADFAIPNSRLFDSDATTTIVLEDISSVIPQLHPSHPHIKAILERVESMSGQYKFLVLLVYDADINTHPPAFFIILYSSFSPLLPLMRHFHVSSSHPIPLTLPALLRLRKIPTRLCTRPAHRGTRQMRTQQVFRNHALFRRGDDVFCDRVERGFARGKDS